MSIRKLLSSWRSEPSIAVNIEAWKTIPAQSGRLMPFPEGIHPSLINALRSSGFKHLYSHQATCWHHVQTGSNVAVVTGTASGKTLCYNLPVLNGLLLDPMARAIYIFPTKALSQDQVDTLHTLVDSSLLPLAVYDGDTPAKARPAIRDEARLVITNPDMLHIGILPHHTSWVDFFRHLQFVVIDEMHTYRGVFGSHVANVIRRMKRIARFYGAKLQFILTSATIANPIELAERLIEENVALVDEDGSARGLKHFLVYNPPVVNRDLGLRRSSLQESVRLAEDLLVSNLQTIIFGRSRRTVELILTYLRQNVSFRQTNPSSPDIDWVIRAIRGYRSGYLPLKRREIESGLRRGDVRAVVATNALELGIDIGGMSAALLVGYPGTIAATCQQAGRAGRGEETSLAILITTADPLDQFLAKNPDYLFSRAPEQALINPDNLLILLDHMRCASFELPFQTGESFGSLEPVSTQEFLDFLQDEGTIHKSGERYFWMADQYPAQDVSLRSASAETVLLHAWEDDQQVGAVTPSIIGEVDQASALWMVHPQAIYLHEGQIYIVDELDLKQNIAFLHRAEVDYYTQPRSETAVQLLETLDIVSESEFDLLPAIKAYGEIIVTSQVVGFRKVKWYTHELLGLGEVSLPPRELQTTGYWLALTEEAVIQLREQNLWSNDPNRYGSNWFTQQEKVRSRDNYKCQVCGASEESRAHDVHHKIPFRNFPSYDQANRLENLITLCQTCHRRAETAVRVRSGLSGLAYLLSHLAPFFLMCDVRDLGVHSDPRSTLTNGQPTVVLYDMVPAGIGFSQHLFNIHDELISHALTLVSACECTDGCPSCVGPGGESGSGGKRETQAILELICAK